MTATPAGAPRPSRSLGCRPCAPTSSTTRSSPTSSPRCATSAPTPRRSARWPTSWSPCWPTRRPATCASSPSTSSPRSPRPPGVRLASPKPLVVPILRAGLGMLDGMMRLLPTAEVGFLGMVRNEETLEASTYAERLPDDLSGRQCYVLDPMLATGGTLAAAIRFLTDRGADHVTAICLLAAPEGCANLERALARPRGAGHRRDRRDGRAAQREGLHRPGPGRRRRPAVRHRRLMPVRPLPDRTWLRPRPDADAAAPRRGASAWSPAVVAVVNVELYRSAFGSDLGLARRRGLPVVRPGRPAAGRAAAPARWSCCVLESAIFIVVGERMTMLGTTFPIQMILFAVAVRRVGLVAPPARRWSPPPSWCWWRCSAGCCGRCCEPGVLPTGRPGRPARRRRRRRSSTACDQRRLLLRRDRLGPDGVARRPRAARQPSTRPRSSWPWPTSSASAPSPTSGSGSPATCTTSSPTTSAASACRPPAPSGCSTVDPRRGPGGAGHDRARPRARPSPRCTSWCACCASREPTTQGRARRSRAWPTSPTLAGADGTPVVEHRVVGDAVRGARDHVALAVPDRPGGGHQRAPPRRAPGAPRSCCATSTEPRAVEVEVRRRRPRPRRRPPRRPAAATG